MNNNPFETFWRERFNQYDVTDLRSGGHAGITQSQNNNDY